ncbi:hypothetical protein ACP70R_030989 [Stipagrostis hirtigluma subsp. patula]
MFKEAVKITMDVEHYIFSFAAFLSWCGQDILSEPFGTSSFSHSVVPGPLMMRMLTTGLFIKRAVENSNAYLCSKRFKEAVKIIMDVEHHIFSFAAFLAMVWSRYTIRAFWNLKLLPFGGFRIYYQSLLEPQAPPIQWFQVH